MSKFFYAYDNKKLIFHPMSKTLAGKIKSLFLIIAICVSVGLLFFLTTNNLVQRTVVAVLENKKDNNVEKFNTLTKELEEKNQEISLLQTKDDKLYRSILEISPLDPSIRNAGFGGAEKYSGLEVYENGALMADVAREIDVINSKLNIQQRSYQTIYELALEKEKEIDCTPSIQPISIDNFERISCNYGYRTDPFLGYIKMHDGVDLVGPRGCTVYSTAEGVVTKAERVSGYGLMVEIDHGFNIITRYGHLDKINVKEGQKVFRGTDLGKLGNTGRSTGPHLHYEVRVDGNTRNPLNFFCNNISANEYNRMIKVLNERSVERFEEDHEAKN